MNRVHIYGICSVYAITYHMRIQSQRQWYQLHPLSTTGSVHLYAIGCSPIVFPWHICSQHLDHLQLWNPKKTQCLEITYHADVDKQKMGIRYECAPCPLVLTENINWIFNFVIMLLCRTNIYIYISLQKGSQHMRITRLYTLETYSTLLTGGFPS